MDVPHIEPVDDAEPRPTWSVMIPAYNRPEGLERTLRSVLHQAPGPEEMQIRVIDDQSPDADLAAVVEEVGGGRVEYHRNEANLGFQRNFTACIEQALGRWVHILHDDDLVLDGFYDAYRHSIDAAPCALAVGRSTLVDATGALIEVSPALPSTDGRVVEGREALATVEYVSVSAVVVARATYELVGGFRNDLAYVADREMWVRAASAGPVAWVDDSYVQRMFHAGSLTSQLQQSSIYRTDALDAGRLIAATFDDRRARRRVRAATRRHVSRHALSTAGAAAVAGRVRSASSNALFAIRLRPTVPVIARASVTTARGVVVAARRTRPENRTDAR